MTFQLVEHAGFTRAHDPHHWWIFDPRETSPKTCPVCLALLNTHYRGDEIGNAFPHHVHMTVNSINPKVHPNCRCRLRWSGRSRDVLVYPIGKKPPTYGLPIIPRRLELSPSQMRQFSKHTTYARDYPVPFRRLKKRVRQK